MRERGLFLSDLGRALSGNVFFLGLVSFLTDLSSEMIYPLLPVFFTGLVPPGLAAVYIGLMEGVAESTSSLLKMYSGRLSDRLGIRKPLALGGYALSSLSRPVLALAVSGWHVIALRFMDRVGKGIRTSPQDALICDSIDQDVRGMAFSFHRLMDHAGAVCGPLAAMVILVLILGGDMVWHQGKTAATAGEMQAMRWVFAAAILPGMAATYTLWRKVRETGACGPLPETPFSSGEKRAPSGLPKSFIIYLEAVLLFALGNSSDLFLIFFAQTRFGLGIGWMIAFWIMLHLSKIVFSLPGGRLSDLAGRRLAIGIGWAIYIGIYLVIPFSSRLWMISALLVLYGAFYGLTEGAERALVADMVPASMRGKAFGLYHGVVGLAALPASLLFGVFWAVIGPAAAFIIGASLAGGALVLLAESYAVSKGRVPSLEG